VYLGLKPMFSLPISQYVPVLLIQYTHFACLSPLSAYILPFYILSNLFLAFLILPFSLRPTLADSLQYIQPSRGQTK
jgi:hypothetical protein